MKRATSSVSDLKCDEGVQDKLVASIDLFLQAASDPYIKGTTSIKGEVIAKAQALYNFLFRAEEAVAGNMSASKRLKQSSSQDIARESSSSSPSSSLLSSSSSSLL